MDYETANGERYDDDGPRYENDRRSASPRPMRDDGRDDGRDSTRRRSASPNGDASERAPKDDSASKDDDGAVNPGSNLFVTGISASLTEAAVSRLFEKYGEVEKCQIMRDPHTKESRGFGFVKMVTSDQADAAKEGLSGEQIEGRTLNIEKARRSRPRTPTPGKYFGPPKREPRRFNDRYDDRRRGGYGGYGRDDPYRYRGYERRYEDRGYDRGFEDRGYERGYRGGDRGGERGGDRGGDRAGYERRERDEGYGGRVDRYREDRDRYGPRGGPDERRGGGPNYERERYDRPGFDRDAQRSRDAPPSAGAYPDARPEGREPYGGGDRTMR